MTEPAKAAVRSSRHREAAQRWLNRQRTSWSRIADDLKAANTRLSMSEARQRVQDYRELARDLAIARRELPGSGVDAKLETLLHGLHLQLHRDHLPTRVALRQLYAERVPQTVRALRPAIAIVVALFLFFTAAAAGLVAAYPELASLFASDNMIHTVESGGLWTDSLFSVAPASTISFGIIFNNVTVALGSFVFGALYGLGTLYMIATNGAMLGALFVFTGQHGVAMRLLSFILPHGVVELSVIMLAAAAGLRLGEALARPGSRSRGEAFSAAMSEAGVLLAVVVPALFVAGIIEGYVSPNAGLGWIPRVLVGASSGFLLWAALTGRFFRATTLDRTGRALPGVEKGQGSPRGAGATSG